MEDDELDKELLALVEKDDENVDEEEESSKSKRGKDKSSKKKRKKKHSDSEGEEDDFAEVREKRKPEPKKPVKKRKGKTNAKSSDSENENVDEYDDDLMGDEEDRRYLQSLPELERERILAERYAKRKELQERNELRKRLRRENDKEKTTAPSSPRRSVRDRTKVPDRSKASAFSDLKRKRARAQTGAYDSGDDSYPSSKEESDEEYVTEEKERGKEKEKPKSKKKATPSTVQETVPKEDLDTLPATADDIAQIILKREWIARKIDEPFFFLEESPLKGFFVRVVLGESRETGRPVYKLGRIIGQKEKPKSYKIENRSTNQYIVLRHGRDIKSFPLVQISNSSFTDQELEDQWKKVAPFESMMKSDVEKLKELMSELENYRRTEDDIRKMVERNKQLNRIPINIAAERARLISQRDAAKDQGQMEEHEKICKSLENLEEMSKKESEKLAAEKTTSLVSQINKRNKESNQSAKFQSEKSGLDADHDPFSRRATKPALPVFVAKKYEEEEKKKAEEAEQNNGSTNGTDAHPPKEPKPLAVKDPLANAASQKKTPLASVIDASSYLYDLHNFEIDLSSRTHDLNLDKDADPFSVGLKMRVESLPKAKRTLSLADYLTRRGMRA